MDFEQALTAELEAVSGLSGKVYPLGLQEDVSAPYAMYQLSSTDYLRALERGSLGPRDAMYQVDAFHTRYGDLKTIVNGIAAALESFPGRSIGTSGPYIQSLEVTNQYEIYEDQVKQYHGIVEFRVFYE